MKINELAKLSGVNAETIRKYRDRGLLNPEQNPENGYYEYSYADFLNLLYIRKLRGASLSLDAIKSTCQSGDAASILAGYRRTIDDLEEQIRQLRRREMMLRVTAKHYERDAEAFGTIRLIEAFGTKYDSYFDAENPDEVRRMWIQNIDLFTMVVCIQQRWFEQETLPARIPVRLGIGTYQEVVDEENLPMPTHVRIFPEGTYASFFLELDELDSVSSEKLVPIRSFLRAHSLHALTDSTAYLYRVDTASGRPRFVFCVRVLTARKNG